MSFDYTGSFSGSFSGEIIASNGVISSSAQVAANLPSGVVSSSTQVTYEGTGLISSSNQISYTGIRNKPTTISAFQKNSITANTRFREVTYPADSSSVSTRLTTLENATDATGSDSQTLSFNDSTNALTISDGNSVDLSSLSGGGGGGSGTALTASDEGSELSKNVRSIDFVGNAVTATNSGNALTVTIGTGSLPSGLLSSSTQVESIIDDTYISASAAASGFGTGGGTSDFNSLINVPSGLVSSSDQILPITTSSITDFDTEVSRSAAEAGFGAGGGTGDITSVIAGLGIGGGANSGDATVFLDTSSVHFRIAVSQSAASYGFGSGGGGGSFGDPPVITSHGFTIPEFTGSNALIGQLVATDVTPGDTQTWAIQDAYTDGFFEVSTTGVVRASVSSSRAMNTDNTPGSGSHPFLIKVTDGQNNVVEKTIYIRVTPNSAPVFRVGGVSGNTITSFTASLDESSSAETKTQYRVYVTDADSDALTIRTGSLGTDHFSFTIGTTGVSKYVDLVQVTSSLDYESLTSYSFVITASDANYEAGYDVPNITHLPFRVEVVDNLGPGIQDQSLSGVNENSSDGTSAGSIVATDNSNPANTILYKDFRLVSAHSGSDTSNPNITSSLGGTALTDPTSDPFQMNIAGAVTRKSSVFLNSHIANRYVYRVNVGDAYNIDSASALITIPIADDGVSTIGTDGNTYYIQEGAETGDNLTTNSNGYTTSNVTFTSAVSQRWEVNTIPSGYVRFTSGYTYATGSSVTLEVDTDISGNLHFADSDTVAIQITASEHGFYTTKQFRDHTLTITDNQPYTIVFTDTSANLNTNGARPSNTLTTISFTEPQIGIGDTIDHTLFSFTDPSGQLTTVKSGDTYYVRPTSNLSGSVDYGFTASIADSYGNITTDSHSITIAQAGIGTLTTNGTFYIIESATNGDNIVLGTNGRTGTQGDLGVTYSPQYNSAAVASFTSSNEYVGVNSSGNLTVSSSISGSDAYFDGDTITSNITFRDQYDNIGSGSITINVTENFSPSGSYTATNANLNTNGARPSNTILTLDWSDTESDALNHSTFTLSSDASITSSWNGSYTYTITPSSNLSAGTYYVSASVKDTHGFSTGQSNTSFTIAQADDGTATANGTLYVIESATSGDNIVTNTNGRTGTQGQISVSFSPNYNSATAQNFTSTSDLIAINSSTGLLTVDSDVSSSDSQSGDTITTTIGWEDQYGNSDTADFTINVATNNAPTVTSDTQTSANLNTNLAVDDALLTTLVWSDTEGDALAIETFNLTGTNASSFSSSYIGSNTFEISANGDLSAGTYNYTANVEDEHGFNEGTYSDTIIISQAGGGTINSENFYIIESALSGAVITNDSDGIGTQADVNVGYSPNYGSQVAEQFNSNHSIIAIDADGNLSVKSDISGSYHNGDSISPTIHWLDQYGNEGTGSITINISNNTLPTATFTDETINAPVSSGTKLVTISISDTENDSPYEVTLSGEGASSMSLAPQNAASSSWFINASDSSMTDAVTLNYTASILDAYGEDVVEYNRDFSVGAAPAADPLIYIYQANHATDAALGSNYLAVMGGSTVDSSTPPKVTGYTANTLSFFNKVKTGALGDSSITLAASKTATLIDSASADGSVEDIIEAFGTMASSITGQVIIAIPSTATNLTNIPTSVASAFGGSTSGEYVLQVQADGGGWASTIEATDIHEVVLDSARDGVTDWFFIGRTGYNGFSNNFELRLRPSSGSAQT